MKPVVIKKQTPWAHDGITRAQYKRSVEYTIRYHVCNDSRILWELFSRPAVQPPELPIENHQ